MAGRRITNNTRAARLKRERMRRYRARDKEEAKVPSFDPRPIAKALENWRTQ